MQSGGRDVGEQPAVVAGGSVAGLATALGLARRGLDVVVLERDVVADVSSADEAFAAPRSGVPQLRHSHVFPARLRELLDAHARDVLQRLLAAGAGISAIVDRLPDGMIDRGPRPGDEQLRTLAARRAALEHALRSAAHAQQHIHLRHEAVRGLRGVRGADGVVNVDGVTLESGDELRANVVVDASGRHTQHRRWLRHLGVVPATDHVLPCGIVYVSRWYRTHGGQDLATVGLAGGQAIGSRETVGWSVIPGDGDTFSVTMTVPVGDRSLLRVRHPDRFDAVATSITDLAAWISPERCHPTTDPLVMGGLVNRRRSLVDEHDRPLVLGFHAVGDAQSHTNPALGWGCSLALAHAFALAQLLADEPDAARRAAGAHEFIVREIDPWYWYSVACDTVWPDADEESGHPTRAGADSETAQDHAEQPPDARLIEALRVAERVDPDVHRAVARVHHLLDPPQTLADILASDAVAACSGARWEAPQAPPVDRDQIVAVLDAR